MWWSRLVDRIQAAGDSPDDTVEERIQKRLLVMISSVVAVIGAIWGVLYLYFEEPVAAAIPFAYSASVTISLFVYSRTGRYRWFRFVQLFLILVLPFLLQLALGGFVGASAVIIWALLAPIGALTMSGRRQAVYWFAAYIALVILAQVVQPTLGVENSLPASVIAVFFVLNILAPTGVAFFALHYLVGQKDNAFEMLGEEREKSERLLLNVLPKDIAEQLKETDQTIATEFPSISVLFADVVGFTPLTEGLTPDGLIEVLNEIFSHFDSLVESYGLEKIRTTGDSYMVAAGIPRPREDHALALAELALDIVHYRPQTRIELPSPLEFRIGLSSGPAVAGVIGTTKFQYDVWGDTVNTASRMESHGVPGRIQITASTYELIKDRFVCEPRGPIEVKGKGLMNTWFLMGTR